MKDNRNGGLCRYNVMITYEMQGRFGVRNDNMRKELLYAVIIPLSFLNTITHVTSIYVYYLPSLVIYLDV